MIRKRPLEIMLVSVIVLLFAFYARYEYIPNFGDQHVAVASERYNIDFGQPGPWFSAWSLGDGQAFAVIAADPTGGLLGVEVKEPVYRFARAGYGWLAGALIFGNTHLIPFALAAVGSASVIALLLVAVKLRDRLGPKAWLIILNPAVFLGFAGDTTEPLGVLVLTLAMASSSVWAAIALGVTRPTYALALLGRWVSFAVAVAAAVGLLVYSLFRFGLDEGLSGGRFDLPLVAYFEHSTIAGWLLALAALVTTLIGVKSRNLAWVVSGVAVLMLGTDVTENPVNLWRAAGMLPVLWAFGPGATAQTATVEPVPATVRT